MSYHQSKALSKSAIDLLLECPAHYKAWLDGVEDEEETKATAFGGMFHKLALEPKTFSQEYAVTDLNLTTKAGKDWKAALPGGIAVVKEGDYEAALLMADAVREHPQAKHLFRKYTAETPIFWINDGVECKAKPDIVACIDGMNFCADLKTTESVNPEAIRRTIARYNYHRQAAWYLEGLHATGTPCEAFLFIFIEKTYPYLVTMCQLDQEALGRGREDCARAMDILKECQSTGIYPCYTRDILTLSLPAWAQ